MRTGVWLTGLAIVFACGPVTTPTPSGTVVAQFDAAKSKWGALAAAAPKATGIAEKTFDATGQDGASVSVRYKTGIVELDGKPVKMPLEATVTVTDSKGFAISGGFSDGPIHFAGMPEDTRALDFDAMLSRGTRSCGGTRYTNDDLRIRLHGDGTATVLPAAGSSSAAPTSRP